MPESWPGRWTPALPAGDDDAEPSFTNDHGTRYLIGDGPDEYVSITGNFPENTC